MAMTVRPPGSDDDLLSTINTTPLVDVMLVLLIIFLITIPVVNSTIAVTLPREQNQRVDAQQENVIVTVDAQGAIYWFDTPLPDRQSLVELLQKIAAMQPQPEVHIRGDKDGKYTGVGKILYACQRAGVTKVAFITEPPPLGG